MSLLSLTLRYVTFAVIATAGNLATQRLVMQMGDHALAFQAALLAGTLVGLVIKYVLDKRWIFADTSRSMRSHGKKFTLYSVMGLFTTGIFWATETTFWLAWQTEAMRETGAVLGLAVGYLVKYRLDRRFVFTDRSLASPA